MDFEPSNAYQACALKLSYRPIQIAGFIYIISSFKSQYFYSLKTKRKRNTETYIDSAYQFSIESDPAAPSDTATLLRLHPNHLSHLRRLAPKGYPTDFGCYKLSWCDGRCVQGPGTYSPRHADPRLLAIPASCRRVAAYNPN